MGYRHGKINFNRILGIVIPYLIMSLFSCHGFFEEHRFCCHKKNPKRMLEYYSSKIFSILECNTNNLAKIPNAAKQRIYAEETDNPDYVMTCINTITSTSNTIMKLLLHKSLHSSCIQK